MRNIILLTCLIFGLVLQQLNGQNAPISTIAEVVTNDNTIVVPITVTSFSNIGGCDLSLNYDPTVVTAISVALGPNIGQTFFLTDISTPGVVALSWLWIQYGVPGLTLTDNSVFLNITFERVSSGYSAIEFDNSLQDNCIFTDENFDELNDSPASAYYLNGSVNNISFQLGLKIFLEGAFLGSEMTTNLNDFNLIPTSQPYSGSPWNYEGTEMVSSIPENVVDWVLVELRETTGDASTATPDKIIARQAGFLLKDGSIKNTDGITNLSFPVLIDDNLYIVIYHRNHVAAISAIPTPIVNENGNYDFSTGEFKVLGASLGHKELSAGIWGLAAGDSNGDGNINDLDKQNSWGQNVGTRGYLPADFSFDAQIGNIDKNDFWNLNFGFISRVP
jgi:hypothetical protein